jgi:tetratricopeptide (TPR) repeat protein
MSHFFAGRFPAARSTLAEAISHLEQVSGSWWELNTAKFFHCLAQLNEGDFLSYAPYVQDAISRAQRRNDMYSQYLFAGHPSIWCGMRNDNVEPAQEALAKVLRDWPRDNHYQVHYSVMAGTAMAHLYQGHALQAQNLIQSSKAMLRDLMIHRLPFVQGEVDKLLGRAALLLGDDATAQSMARRLRKSHLGVANAMGRLLQAPLAAKQGNPQKAQTLLLEAKALYSECGARHLAQACNYQLGKLIGGKRGDEMSAAAIGWLEGQGVVVPERMFQFLSPGFS